MTHHRNRHFQKRSHARIGPHQLRLIQNRFLHTVVQFRLHTGGRSRIASRQAVVQQDLNKKINICFRIFQGFEDFVGNSYRLQFRSHLMEDSIVLAID